ncbi:MAG: glycosyltransferase family 2 protein [Planctomyces sp.]|nr:glycosyltransferase family 2 protein [Planctomyces sp.]
MTTSPSSRSGVGTVDKVETVKGLVSTVIPVFNRGHLIKRSVESVILQDYRPIEIILVNDGSTDDTGSVLEQLRAQYGEEVIVLHQANAGPGAARETGRQAARGEFIQYLDSDDRLLPGKFTAQVAALQANVDCGIAYGKTRLVDETDAIIRAPYKKSGEKIEYLFPELLVDRWWNTHTPLYRRAVCDLVGAWPSNRMSEDWQYDARFGALRTRLVYCDLYVSEHLQHSGDRLTRGSLSRQKLCDISDLMPVLYSSAVEAGVAAGSPQMRHFSRWAFSLARQLGVQGETQRAEICLKLARQAGDGFRNSAEIFLVGQLASLIGWKRMQSTMDFVMRLRGRTHGQQTLPPSWL